MLQAGFWADAPKTREIIYNFARLRALRVEVDNSADTRGNVGQVAQCRR